MRRDQVRPGTKVTAGHGVRYAIGKDAETIRTVAPGTPGVILAVDQSRGWTEVRTRFDGHEHEYTCDVAAAVFAMRYRK